MNGAGGKGGNGGGGGSAATAAQAARPNPARPARPAVAGRRRCRTGGTAITAFHRRCGFLVGGARFRRRRAYCGSRQRGIEPGSQRRNTGRSVRRRSGIFYGLLLNLLPGSHSRWRRWHRDRRRRRRHWRHRRFKRRIRRGCAGGQGTPGMVKLHGSVVLAGGSTVICENRTTSDDMHLRAGHHHQQPVESGDAHLYR